MRNCVVFFLCLVTVKTKVSACDEEELSRHLYNATLQENCYQNATSCQSTCTSGHVLENGSQTTNHVCNGTSWIPNTITCLPAQTPVMTTNFTIVYVTEDQPAGNCLYSFNVRMWESLRSFRNTIRSTCAELKTGSISIENLELSALAFQVSLVFHVKFSGEGTETSRDVCMNMIEIISNGNQNYLKPFSSISCNALNTVVTKKQTIKSATFEYNCTDMLGSQLLVASSGGVRCVLCFPGTYLNSTQCEPCLQGTYQAVPGQLTCDVCSTGKHVTEDSTECLDSVCVSTFLSQKIQGIDLTCNSESQMCMSTCLSGYIQNDGGLSTVYNCSGERWFPPLKSCIKYEYSTYHVDLEAVYTTNDALAITCLSQFQTFTFANRDYFQTNISTSCVELHGGNVTIENITIGSIAFQIKTTFHLKFYGSWPTKTKDLCMDITEIYFRNSPTYLQPYTVLQCTDGQTNVTKVSAQRSGRSDDMLHCPDGRQVVNSTEAFYCIPCSAGTISHDLICLPCPNGTYQPLIGQTFCHNCSDWSNVNEDRTECRLEETTTLDNISYTVSSPTAEVTSSVNVTEQSTENFTTASFTTTDLNITTDIVETTETTQNTMPSISTESPTSISLTTTVVSIETTETTTEKTTSSSLTTTAMRTTKGYTIPCGVDQLSSAISNSKYTCAAHNQTCSVECNSGYVTSEGMTSVEYRCEGNVWTPNRKLCLEYDVPFTTSALYTTYNTLDQVASSCLQDFQEITERNKDLFQKTITDYCGDLGITAGGLKIENITSNSLAFRITNTILLTFYEESVDVRDVCLDYITLIFPNVPSLLHPYSRLNCSSGLSDVTKVSASHGSPSYSCNNRTYLVNKTSQLYCVPCAPGTYMVSSQCVPCYEGYYQPLPGQLTCELCTGNRTVVEGGANCTEIVNDENELNLGKSQVGPTGLTTTEIIVIAVVSVCVISLLVVIATIYYCKKSKAKRRTSHADVPANATSADDMSVKSDEYLRRSQENLIPNKSSSTDDPSWTYQEEKVEKSTFSSPNEAKALDVLSTIININIDNEECITAQPPVFENVREGKWRPLRHKNESNAADVIDKAKETKPDKTPCRTLSDYDNFQIYLPEPELSDPD